MKDNRELIETLHPGKQKGVSIEKEVYTLIANMILHKIDDTSEITLAALIIEAEQIIPSHPNLAWLVYHVKLDLEAKGLIQLLPSRRRRNSFVLSLTANAQRRKGNIS